MQTFRNTSEPSFQDLFLPLSLPSVTLRSGTPVTVNGNDLSLAGVIAIARYGASVELDQSPEIKERVERSMRTIMDKLAAGKSEFVARTHTQGTY